MAVSSVVMGSQYFTVMSLNSQSCLFVFLSLQPNGGPYADGHGLVTIRMKPDSQGRFGFNVKVSHQISHKKST